MLPVCVPILPFLAFPTVNTSIDLARVRFVGSTNQVRIRFGGERRWGLGVR